MKNIEEVFNEHLRKMTDDYFFKGKELWSSIEDGGSHSHWTEEKVKNPSDILIAAVRLRDALKKERNNAKTS